MLSARSAEVFARLLRELLPADTVFVPPAVDHVACDVPAPEELTCVLSCQPLIHAAFNQPAAGHVA